MKKTSFLVCAFVTIIVIGACKSVDNAISSNFDELLIGQWTHSESTKSGGTSDTLSFKRDNTFEWIYYEYVPGPFGYEHTTIYSGTWRIANDSLFIHAQTTPSLDVKAKITKLNGKSLHWDIRNYKRKMTRLK